jgi:serine/threonine protein phosphatase PrpC
VSHGNAPLIDVSLGARIGYAEKMTIPASASLQFGPCFDVAVRTSAGVGVGAAVRSENQDNFLLIDGAGRALFLRDEQECRRDLAEWAPGQVRLAILDGMGGHGQGREAAEAVVQGLLAMPPCASVEQLSERLDQLHARLQTRFNGADRSPRRPGTTLTLLELRPGQPALLYHVGDSRLYQIAPQAVTPLTVDHVPATVLALAGLLGEQAWWQQVHAEHGSQIAQAFILGNALATPAQLSDSLFALTAPNLPPFLRHLPDRRAIELDPACRYLLATDGFWSCAAPQPWVRRWSEVLDAGHGAADMLARLFDEIEQRPPPELHPDNLTAILLLPQRACFKEKYIAHY